MYANDGTAIEAQLITGGSYFNGTDLVDASTLKGIDIQSNCCGLSFADGKLNLGNEEAATLIDKEYSSLKLSNFDKSDIAVVHQGENIKKAEVFII